MKTKINSKLYAERVASEWSEGGPPDGDGYWMSLRDGWKLEGASIIHEWTRQACLDRLPECIQNFTESELRARIQKQVETYPPGSYGEYLNRTNLPDCRETWNQFLSDSLRAAAEPFPSLLQSAEDERREELNWEQAIHDANMERDDYHLRDEGRNPDGSAESYAERNA